MLLKKLLNKTNSEYYDGSVIAALDKLLSAIFGGRGNGKSYWWVYIKTFEELESGRSVVLVRKTCEEIKALGLHFRKKLIEKGITFENYGSAKSPEYFLPSYNCTVYFMAIRGSAIHKSTNLDGYKDVKYIIIDEIIPDAGQLNYKDDIKAFNSLMSTLTRDHEHKRIVLIGNSITKNNPFVAQLLKSYDIPKKEGEIYVYDNCAIELCKTSDTLKNRIEKTAFAALIKNDVSYMSYVLGESSFIYDNNFNIRLDREMYKKMRSLVCGLALSRENIKCVLYQCSDGSWQVGEYRPQVHDEKDFPWYSMEPFLAVKTGYPLIPDSINSKLVHAIKKHKLYWNDYILRDEMALYFRLLFQQHPDLEIKWSLTPNIPK